MLKNFREKIDVIDAELVKKLAERFEITRKVGEHKRAKGLPARDCAREDERIDSVRILARKYNIDEQMVEKIWRLIMERVVEENAVVDKTGIGKN